MAPLSTPLSQLLIAFTIELDNEFEHRFAEAVGGARITSVVMWENRFGKREVDELRGALTAVADRLRVRLPEYLPIVVSSAGLRAEVPHANRELPAAAGV